MQPLSILFFISSLRVGGAERHLLNLCRFLALRGHRTRVCNLGHGADVLEADLREAGAWLDRLSIGSLRHLAHPAVVARLKRVVRRAAPDIVHAHLYHAEVAAAVATFFTPAPLVATRHSCGLEFNGARRLVAAVAGRRVRRLIAVSAEAAEEARRCGLPSERIATIPNGVDTSRFRPLERPAREEGRADLLTRHFRSRCNQAAPLIGSLGSLKPLKNHAGLIEAFARIAAARREPERPRLLILGEGPCRAELERLAVARGAGELVAFPGNVERPETYLPLLDLFVLPSLSEGLPMALLEAMSCGAACVASNVGGIGPLLAGVGEVVPPGDTDRLQRTLERLLADPVERENLGLAARRRAAERYGLDAWGERTLAVYRAALS